jgi:hypothetical protein
VVSWPTIGRSFVVLGLCAILCAALVAADRHGFGTYAIAATLAVAVVMQVRIGVLREREGKRS